MRPGGASQAPCESRIWCESAQARRLLIGGVLLDTPLERTSRRMDISSGGWPRVPRRLHDGKPDSADVSFPHSIHFHTGIHWWRCRAPSFSGAHEAPAQCEAQFAPPALAPARFRAKTLAPPWRQRRTPAATPRIRGVDGQRPRQAWTSGLTSGRLCPLGDLVVPSVRPCTNEPPCFFRD